MNKLWLMPGCALLLALSGCSESSGTAEKRAAAEKAAEPITGQTALYRMYQVARSWAPDVQVLKMNSILLPEAPAPPGKGSAFEATFTSAEKGRARSYTYCIIEGQGNLHKGVFAGLEESWTGSSGLAKPFLIAAVKVDTDAAYKTALAKAADYDKKNQGKPISLLLEKNPKFPDPVWRVIWGESVGTSAFSVFVDASTGLYLETMH